MDMEMSTTAMSAPKSSGTHIHSMSGMASTFSINTHVTLWFTEWTTDTAVAYAFTVIFLFCLGILNRFLGALKTQLERRWKDGPVKQDYAKGSYAKGSGTAHEQRENASTSIKGHVRRWSRAIYSKQSSIGDDGEEMEPLSPLPTVSNSDVNGKHSHASRKRFWVPSAAWSLKRDSIRAFLEFIRAVIGYILMLAVMTYNVGFFFAVTGSVLLGELIYGRYTHSIGWQEGGCHE